MKTQVFGNEAIAPLTPAEISTQLESLPGWAIEGDELICTYPFANFVESVDFVNRLVEPAEAAGHHPDLTVSYSRVTVRLTTHDAGGLTNLDFEVAKAIAAIAQTLPDSPTCQPE